MDALFKEISTDVLFKRNSDLKKSNSNLKSLKLLLETDISEKGLIFHTLFVNLKAHEYLETSTETLSTYIKNYIETPVERYVHIDDTVPLLLYEGEDEIPELRVKIYLLKESGHVFYIDAGLTPVKGKEYICYSVFCTNLLGYEETFRETFTKPFLNAFLKLFEHKPREPEAAIGSVFENIKNLISVVRKTKTEEKNLN